MRHARMRWVSFFTLLFVFGFSPHSRAAPIFSVLKIERPVGVIGYRAFGLNDAGTVVGSLYYSDYHDHAAVWEAGSLTDYGTFGFKHAGFRRITSDGRIIGFIQDGPTPPLTWTDTILFKDGALTRLGTLDGPADEGHRSWPYEINESERIVGNSYIHSETGELLSSRPFLWQDGIMHDFGGPSGYAPGKVISINDAGDVIGIARDALNQGVGYTWSAASGFTVLPKTPAMTYLGVAAINSAGHVVGHYVERGVFHPFFFDGTSLVPLPVPEGVGDVFAYGIDDFDQIIAGSVSGPLLWDQGQVYNLNDLIPPEDILYWHTMAINNAGQILLSGDGPLEGEATFTDSYLLTPLPEPSLISLLSLAVLLPFSRAARRFSSAPT